MLKSLIGFSLFVGLSQFVFANDESGCLVTVNSKSLKIDENCDCLKTNSCSKFKTFKMDENLFGRTDINNRPLFSNVEKAKMRESFKAYDKIIKLRLAGKANSAEIKQLYIELDKLNEDVRSSFLKTQSKYLAKSKSAYQKNVGKLKQRRSENIKLASSILSNSVDSSQFNAAAEKKPMDEVKNVRAKDNLRQDNPIQASSQSSKQELAEISAKAEDRKLENEIILKNIKPDKLDRKEEDSIFEIITKTYMKSAYPKLLKPLDD